MAVRGGDNVQCAEPDATWLNDLPKPVGAGGVKTSQEPIPAPPAKSDSVPREPPVPKPELGEGFKLAPAAPQGDDTPPPIKGLEPTPANPPPVEKPPAAAADGGGPALPAAQPSLLPSSSP